MKLLSKLSTRIIILLLATQLLILALCLYFQVFDSKIDFKKIQEMSLKLDRVAFPHVIEAIIEDGQDAIDLYAQKEEIDLLYYKDNIVLKSSESLPSLEELKDYYIDDGMKVSFGRGPQRRGPPPPHDRVVRSDPHMPKDRIDFRPRVFGIYNSRSFRVFESIGTDKIIFIDRIKEEKHNLVFIFFALVFFIIVSSVLLVISWLSPLKRMSRGLKKVGQGLYDTDFDFPNTQEFSVLKSEFQKMTKDIKTTIESRDLMLRSLSHDVRSPLARMKLNLEFMGESKYKNDIEGDVEFIDYLVEQVIQFDRIRNTKSQTEQTLDLYYFLQDLESRYKNITREIVFLTQNQEIILNYSKEELNIIFHNLLDNAIKYTSEGNGRIEIHQVGQSVTVTDNGFGIPLSDLPFIFEPFFKADRARNPQDKGYGLGLSMAREMLLRRGGSIEVTSSVGVGTTFTINFC